MLIKLMLTFALLKLPQIESYEDINQPKHISAFLNGDFIIGVLLPLHDRPSTEKRSPTGSGIKCGKIREHYGIQRLEVTFQTIDEINRNLNLLPNLRLGVEVRDECWNAPIALRQSIELIRDTITPIADPLVETCPTRNRLEKVQQQRGRLIGVIGPGASSIALQVQNLLQLFNIPQVGYSTTSRDFSDKTRFHYFMRVVPSDYYQAQVMLAIVQEYGWTYVSTVNTDENYGQSGIQAFREVAEKANVCIAREHAVLSDAPDHVFDYIIMDLRKDPNANVVVCFCEGMTVRNLLKATRRMNVTNHFLFIGSDGWADRREVIINLDEEAWGSFSIRIHSPYIKSFDNYYFSLNPKTNTRNPWFNEFWETRFNCTLKLAENQSDVNNSHQEAIAMYETQSSNVNRTLKSTRRICTGEENLADEYEQDSKLSFVIKAIYTFAHGLHAMQKDLCGNVSIGVCDKLLPFNGSLFKNYLMNTSFEYGNEIIAFDNHGDPPARYDIINYQKLSNGSFAYVKVGSWTNGSLLFNGAKMLTFGRKRNVKAVCSEECPQGFYKKIQAKRCCWSCIPCSNDEFVDTNNTCHRCRLGSVPNETKTGCNELPIDYMKWSDAQAIIAIFFATIGFLTTTFALFVFHKYKNTPVVKSSTKELCYIILFGMFVSHGSIFTVLAKPTILTCALSRILPGFSFALIYAALLTKTNRIARILAGSKKRFPTRKPILMSAGAQVSITSFLVFFEIFIIGSMLNYQYPNIDYIYTPFKTLLVCNTTPEGVLVPLAFDFFLIILCTIYAIKTRNVPENFNEAKFIGFAMYTTCVIWIAFVPIYFGSDSKVITLAMCITLSATVTWIFLFIPKLYIILLKPERNNRALFTTNKNIRCHIGTKVATALSDKSSMNSWRDSTTTTTGREIDRDTALPQKRTLSCQTGTELLQVLLDPKMLMNNYLTTPQITERDCCEADTCQMKKIIIKIPDKPMVVYN